MQSQETPDIAIRIQRVTDELRDLHNRLLCGPEMDPRIVADFREAVNRVRTTAWGLVKVAEAEAIGSDPGMVFSVLSSERVRLTFQLCKVVRDDLQRPAAQFQRGPLIELYEATNALAESLRAMVAK
jgi:hypothetical protein